MLINGGLNCNNFGATEGEERTIRFFWSSIELEQLHLENRYFNLIVTKRDESELLYLGNTFSSLAFKKFSDNIV